MNLKRLFLGIAGASCAALAADRGNPDIHANQVGYFPDMPKVAILRAPGTDSGFSVVTEPEGNVVYQGFGSGKEYWAGADDTIRRYDFTAFNTPGTYRVQIPGVGVSYPFVISRDAYTAVTKAAIKAFYYQRSSTALPATYAGIYARAAGHLDTKVLVHNSAATAQRAANSTISSPKGWYDAGDYGKYIVNSGISTWTLLDLYLQAPKFFDTLDLNIPESGNKLPDLLDEALWNLEWMRTMQDLDGGVYHKLTTADFSGFVMPADDVAPRYVVQKSTAAALDFAAVMAQTSRIFRRFESVNPGYADTCLNAAKRAWDWAQKNPAVYYNQGSLANPTVSTGTYGDNNVSDEKIWAAMELTIATRADTFWKAAFPTGKVVATFVVPGWAQVSSLGLMSALSSIDSLVGIVDTTGLRAKLAGLGANATSRMTKNPYRVPVVETDLNWGSTSVTNNLALLALHQYRITGDTALRNAALAGSDWILGRNALGTSFVTGFGTVTPQHPHHRPSGADGIAAPIPGFVVGGPNKSREDASACESESGASYAYTIPALSWLDDQCSYASNEVAINWNAPLAAVLGILQAGELDSWVSGVTPLHGSLRTGSGLAAFRENGALRIRSLDGTALQEVRVVTPSGRVLAKGEPGTSQWTLAAHPSGLLIVQARTAHGWSSLSTTGF